MAPTVKSKKNAESINSRLQLVTKSGKYTLGYKTTLKTVRQGKGKCIINIWEAISIYVCVDGMGAFSFSYTFVFILYNAGRDRAFL